MTLQEIFLASAWGATFILAAVWIWSLYRVIDEITEIMMNQSDVMKKAVDSVKNQETSE